MMMLMCTAREDAEQQMLGREDLHAQDLQHVYNWPTLRDTLRRYREATLIPAHASHSSGYKP